MEKHKEKETKLKKIKRVLALIGIVLLLGLYGVTLITSFLASPISHTLFIASLVCTGFIPVAIYIFIWLLKFR
nr:hypothetical protein [uncultured Catonella sp.]